MHMPYSSENAPRHIPSVLLAGSEEGLGLSLDDVVVVFACSENFVPYLSVAVQSLVENTSPERNYDIIVLTRDISPSSMLTLSRQVNRENIGIGFLDVEAAIGNRNLPHYGHFRLETYFRLLAPSLLPSVEKAVYLDSDLVVLDDVAKLWDTDVTGKLIGATRDADTVGQIDGYDQGVGPYLANDLGLTDPHTYFQAGVLVMNLAEFRRRTTPEMLLELATRRVWRWLDQDVLNKVVDGDYVRINMKWNFLYDWCNLRRKSIIAQAPEDFRAEYDAARENPCIVHYAGPDDRPWLYPDCDLGHLFWDFAKRSPYLGTLRERLEDSHVKPTNVAHRAKAALALRVGMPLFDKLFPPKSVRRKYTIGAYMRMGGSLG